MAAKGAGGLWNERLAAAFRRWRTKKLADRDFKRRAAANPLTRPFARRSAKRLFDLTAGFVYSQILKAVIELDVLGRLADGPKSAEALSGPLGLTPAATRRLLDAAVALDLVEKTRDEKYELGALGAALNSEPGVKAMIAHHDMLYDDLRDPVALLKGEAGPTRLSGFWPYASGAEGDVAPYSELMATSQTFVAEDVLDAFSFGDRNSLMDLGGGDGAFAAAAAKRWPHLEVTLVDLPPVAERAKQRFEREGFSDRVKAIGADLKAQPPELPRADVVSFVRVLHDHDDAVVTGLLETARRSLTPSGEIMIAEPLAEMAGARTVGHAYFGFYLLAMGSGRPRAPREFADLLHRAGFDLVRTRETSGALPLGVTTARRAGDKPIWRS